MSPMTTLDRLRDIFREVCDDQELEISENTVQEDIPAWDSVITIQIVLAVEAEFNVRLTTDEVAAVHSVRDLLNAVER